MGLTIIGAYVIAKHVIQHILERWRRDKLPKRYTSPLVLLISDEQLNARERFLIEKEKSYTMLWS